MESTTETVEEWNVAPDDILIIEVPKKNSVDWAF